MGNLIHTKKIYRKRYGDVESYILKTIMKNPSYHWQTKDIVKILEKEFGITERKGIINNLKKLMEHKFIERVLDGNNTFYKLPNNYKSDFFLEKLCRTYPIWAWRFMQFYPTESVIALGKLYENRKKVMELSMKKRFLSLFGSLTLYFLLSGQGIGSLEELVKLLRSRKRMKILKKPEFGKQQEKLFEINGEKMAIAYCIDFKCISEKEKVKLCKQLQPFLDYLKVLEKYIRRKKNE